MGFERAIVLFVLELCIHLGSTQKSEKEVTSFNPREDNFTLSGLVTKNWDGPYHQDALLGAIIHMPCSLEQSTNQRLSTQRDKAAKDGQYWSLLWVHQGWDNVVDPWMGDGRRSYDPIQVVPYWEATDAHIEQASLKIIDANPTDNGIYACVVATYPLQKGLSPVILSQTQVVSLHFLRLKEGQTMKPECENVNPEENLHCHTGLEPWTHNVYYPSGSSKGDVLFQAECQADIYLSVLALGGVDPTFWSVVWRFVPRQEADETHVLDMSPWTRANMTAPVHICHIGAAVPCLTEDEWTKIEPRVGTRDLATARMQAAKLWKARWLVLTGTAKQESGRWQCWVESLGLLTHYQTQSFPVRWFINEVHIKIIPESDLYTWWTTPEFWRVLGLVAAPTIVVLFGLIMAVGRTAAYLHPEKIPPKKEIKLLLDEPGDEKAVVAAETKDVEEFEPYAYMHQFLIRQGTDSYHDTRRSSRVLFR